MGTEQPGPSESDVGVEAVPDMDATLVPAVREQFPAAKTPEQQEAAIDWAKWKQRMAVAKKTLEIALMDPAVREGAAASARTAINAAISVADMFPGFGAMTSWGADAAKIWARIEHSKQMAVYERKRTEARQKGEDPEKIKKPELSPIDLTPDVSVEIATGTELLEMAGADFFPTHAIETSLQLKEDWPRMKAMAERLRAIANEQARVTQAESEAAAAFGVVIDVKDENPPKS